MTRRAVRRLGPRLATCQPLSLVTSVKLLLLLLVVLELELVMVGCTHVLRVWVRPATCCHHHLERVFAVGGRAWPGQTLVGLIPYCSWGC